MITDKEFAQRGFFKVSDDIWEKQEPNFTIKVIPNGEMYLPQFVIEPNRIIRLEKIYSLDDLDYIIDCVKLL